MTPPVNHLTSAATDDVAYRVAMIDTWNAMAAVIHDDSWSETDSRIEQTGHAISLLGAMREVLSG